MNLTLNPFNSLVNTLSKIDIRFIAIFINIIFSYIVIKSNPLLNDDAYVYLKAAELYIDEGAISALSNYGWVGYSVLFATLNKILPIGLLNCAYLINTFAYSILIYSFISLVSEHHKSYQLQFFAALTILIFPHINELRGMIIRDFGFWAFSITALLQLVRFNHGYKLINAIGWSSSILIAIFFRIEGILLLIFTPFSLLLSNATILSKRIKAFSLLVSIILGLTFLVSLTFIQSGLDLNELINYAYRFYIPKLQTFLDIFSATSNSLNTSIFSPLHFPGHSEHGYIILFISYTYIITINLINSFSVPLSTLFIYGLITKQYRCTHGFLPPILFFFGITFFTLLVFIFIMHFLTQRYAVLMSLLLLTFIPIVLDNLFNIAKTKSIKKHFYGYVGAVAFFLLIDSLISFGYSKAYIERAIDWTNNNLDRQQILYSNERSIAYFSGLNSNYDSINEDTLNYIDTITPGQYIAVNIKKRNLELFERLQKNTKLEFIINFSNRRNDQVRIYRAKPSQ